MGARERIELNNLSGLSFRCCTVELEDCYLHIYFLNDSTRSPEPFSLESTLLNESRTQNIGRGESVRFDKNHAFADPDKDHIHYYKHGRELLAINRDGTAHDGSSGVRIPNSVFKFIKDNYPDFNLPDNRILEELVRFDTKLNEEIQYVIDNQATY